MLRMSLAVPAALALLAGAAQAEPADGWSGFSVALGGGGSHVDTDAVADTSLSNDIGFGLPTGFRPPSRIDVLIDGQADNSSKFGDSEWTGFGTIQAAYDQRFGSFLIGALIDFDFYGDKSGGSSSSDLDGAFTLSGTQTVGGVTTDLFPAFSVPVDGYASYKANVELDNVWSVGGKLGYLLNDSTLIYAVGGYTEASIDGSATLTFDTLISGPQTISVSMPDELHGFFVGGGGEYKFTENLALRLEYRYAKYGSDKSSASFNDSRFFGNSIAYLSLEDAASLKADVDAEIHSVRGALVMKLGMP